MQSGNKAMPPGYERSPGTFLGFSPSNGLEDYNPHFDHIFEAGSRCIDTSYLDGGFDTRA